MPLIELSGADAVATRKGNPFANWGNRTQANRVEPVTKPGFAVPFQMDPGEKIFTVGSCFARHVETALIKRGFEIPMRELFSGEEFIGMDLGVVNNFGTPSIYNEFSWALGLQDFTPEDHIIEVQKDKYVDMHLIPSIRPADWDTVMHRRKAITAAYQSFKECKVIIITLGLVELWYDTKTGYYLNSVPRPLMLKREPDRFKLHVLTYEETYDYLEKTIALIQEHGRPDIRMVLTVSPVPLTATHRDEDVIVANTYSKSVLRAVADAITTRHDIVTYYPSYESIIHSDRQIAWRDDFTHVTDEIVALNINRMVDAFVVSSGSIDGHHEAIDAGGVLMAVEIAETVRKGSATEASTFFEEFGTYSQQSTEFAIQHGHFLIEQKEFEAAVNILNQAPKGDANNVDLLKAQALMKLGQAQEAYTIVDIIAENGSKSASVWTPLLDAAKMIGDPDLVIEVLNRWTRVVPQRASRANAMVGRWFHQRGEYGRAVKFFEVGTSLNVEDALIRIYHVETLLSMAAFDEAKSVFATIRPQQKTEFILYERLKPRLAA